MAIASAVVVIVADAPAFRASFIFDDQPSIQKNLTIRQLWRPGPALHPPGGDLAVSGRPIVNYSLALNYAINRALDVEQRPDPYGPNKVVGYHILNLLFHLACGAQLFGLIRRTIREGRFAEDWTSLADPLAAVIVAVWLLHPIQTEAVNYVVQRTELLVSAFYLATLYASVRAWDAATQKVAIGWRAIAIAAVLVALGEPERAIQRERPIGDMLRRSRRSWLTPYVLSNKIAAMRHLSCVLVLAILAGRSGIGEAQRVSGRVRESQGSTPVAGAVVTLFDSAGRTIARTVSNSGGTFHVAGDGTAVALSAIHVGFAPATTRIQRASADSSFVVDVSLDRLPTILGAVSVQDRSLCPAATNAGAAFALWDEARKALLATVVAREVDPPTVRLLSYERQMDAKDEHVDQQAVSDSIYVASRPLSAARTAAEFAARGYRERGDNGQATVYYAPDADILLDSTFLAGHCLSLRDADHDHPMEAAIAFSPRGGKSSAVDIQGVFWLTRETHELRSLTFQYTNLSATDAGARGELSFTTMPTGIAMISRWSVHLPIVKVDIRGLGAALQRPVRIVGFRDTGGELAEVGWNDGLSWIGSLGSISGHVSMAGGRVPMPDATVRLEGTRMETRTDSSGAFVLPMTVPGSYVVEAEDNVMTRLGVRSTRSARVVLGRTELDSIRLDLPSRSAPIAALCKATSRGSRSGATGSNLLIGKVRFADGSPAPDAYIRAEWADESYSGGEAVRFGGRSDSTGTFVLCGAPTGVRMTLDAVRDSLVSDEITVTVDSLQHIGYAGLALTVPSPTLPAYRRRQIRITAEPSQASLAGVEVDDAATDRTLGVTPANGTVSLATLPPGRTLLRIRKIGYEQRTMIVDVGPNDSLPMVLPLRTVTQLAAVKVTAAASAATSRLAFESGFEDRAAVGLGHFLRAADFDRHPGENLADALRSIGVKNASDAHNTAVVLLGGHGSAPCPVTIYIDGTLEYTYLWSRIGISPPDVSSMYGTDFGAAEYYAGGSEIPAEYNGTDSGCGVLLLWRRY